MKTIIAACKRKHGAFALGETLILIIVVLLAFGGIFSSMGVAMRLRSRSQVDLDGYLTAQAWFEALEAQDMTKVTNDNALDTAAEGATMRLGGEKQGKLKFVIRSFSLEPSLSSADTDGSRGVELKVTKPDEGGVLKFSRRFNTFSAATVQDNASKRRDP